MRRATESPSQRFVCIDAALYLWLCAQHGRETVPQRMCTLAGFAFPMKQLAFRARLPFRWRSFWHPCPIRNALTLHLDGELDAPAAAAGATQNRVRHAPVPRICQELIADPTMCPALWFCSGSCQRLHRPTTVWTLAAWPAVAAEMRRLSADAGCWFAPPASSVNSFPCRSSNQASMPPVLDLHSDARRPRRRSPCYSHPLTRASR